MIQRSESRPHPLNPGAMRHAFARHGGVTNSDLQARSATMMGKNKDASAFMNSTRRVEGFGAFDDSGNLVSTDFWEALTLNDQAFIIANVLNSRFGQDVLGLMNHALASRLTISALPFTDTTQRPLTRSMALMDFKMRVSTSGQPVSANQLIGRLTIIVEGAGTNNGYPELHFVTAFPMKDKLHPKFGMMPGAERTVSFSGRFSTTPAAFKWDSPDQNDGAAALIPVP
jgi:hypothetical protein